MRGLPIVTAQRRDDTHSELDLMVNSDCPWLEGHFPGQPILPGVVQIGWAVHFACEIYGYSPGVNRLEQVKFKRPILPGKYLTLHLTPSGDLHKLRYEYRDSISSFSSGTLHFGAAV
ncbi:MAG TPA: thioester dehydrase [Gammaproteobacteria bacterium]|nr:thioester dehydrase [Gammaproteobacteria bacterium]